MRELKVFDIKGEYASLVDSSGEELIVAMALLPDGTDVGDELIYQDLEFRFKQKKHPR